VLFLGAGVSHALGLHDLQGITTAVIDQLDNQGQRELVHHIITTLERANVNSSFFNPGEIDLEIIFSVMNGIANSTEVLRDSGPYSIYINELGGSPRSPYADALREVAEIGQIRARIGQIIMESCINPNIPLALGHFRRLFELGIELAATQYRGIFEHIVTTNYDLIVERCSRENHNIHGKRGFEREDDTDEYYLPVEKIVLGTQHSNFAIEYLKLHGSIDWWIRDRDNRIIRRDTDVSLTGERYRGQLMIYPIYEKYISKDPFFSLYYYFRKLLYLHNRYVVIGYSFRDPSINNAFADALRDTNKRMIIVNPDRNSMEWRVDQSFPNDRVDIIETAFGEPNLVDDLRDLLI
jgi:hypothetical protein